ncbi:MAG: hypothetical protein ACOYYS_02815 [Chloroflexota bacterium]
MFDEFRQEAGDGFQESADEFKVREAPRAKSKLILGMTAPQRFMIALLLLMWACTASGFLLLIFDKLLFFE